MPEGQSIISCKKCGSNKVNRLPLALTFLIMGSCLIWIPVIGWILAPIFLIIALILPLIPNGKVFMRCEECKHVFDVKKSVYKEYKDYIQ